VKENDTEEDLHVGGVVMDRIKGNNLRIARGGNAYASRVSDVEGGSLGTRLTLRRKSSTSAKFFAFSANLRCRLPRMC